MISLVPYFGDTPVPPMKSVKSILVYETLRLENTTAPKPPNMSTSLALDLAPASNVSPVSPSSLII